MFRTVAPLLRPVQQHCRTSYAGAVDRHVQLNIRIAKMDTLEDVAQCVERNLGSMNVVNMVTCMHRAARHSSQDTKKATALIYRLANRLTAFMTKSGPEGIAELRPMSLSNAVWAIASVGGSTDWKIEVVAAMRTLITPHLLTTMKPQLLANIAWGIAKIHQQRKLQRHERWYPCECAPGFPHGRLRCDPSSVAVIESIAQEVTRRGRGLRSWPELQPQNVSNIVWSFGVLLDADVVVVEAGLRELLVLQQALQPRARDIRAQHVNNTTWAIARLYSREADSLLPREVQEAADRLFDSATRRPSDFRPADWANLSWSYAKLKDSHKQQIADCGIVEMAPEVFERRTGIDAAAGPRSVDLANVLWAMAKLRLYSLKDFAERCVDRYLTEDRLWAECSAHHMSSLAICAEQMSLRNLEGIFDKIGGAIVEASHGFHRVDGPTIASLLPVFVTAGQHLRHERALLKLRSLCDSASLEPGELVIVNHALSQLPSRPDLFRPIAWEDYSLTVMTDMFKADQSLCEEALNDPSSKIGTVAVAAARSGDREADRSDRARNEVRLGAGFWQRVVDLAMDGLFSRTPLERAQLFHALGKIYHPGTRKLAQLVDAATTAVEAMDPASVAFCIHGMAALDVTPLPEEVADAAWRKLPEMNRMESIKTAYSLILGRESLRDSRVLDTLAHALAIRSECPVDMQFQEAIAAHCGVTFEPACHSPVIRKESSAPKPSAGQGEVGQALTMMRVPHRVEVDVGVGGYSIDMLITSAVSKQSFPYYDQFVFCDGTLQ
ncbi:hypothetical protein FOZ60_015851 [Perkinsus olseni]|uniref:Uncharacterized protein n=1 Tax=Perkinsus olseni TaxID=32597 RepID=A0A7J6P5A7_PEROL|nr:hypothetical protein FOZ60_015851 [Perkinsus olseni]